MKKSMHRELVTLHDYTNEANRYLQNAKETIKKSPVDYGRYQDPKYVSEAAGIGYLAALKAINGYLIVKKGYSKKELPTSIEAYRKEVKKIPHNGKLLNALIDVYDILHIGAYYHELENTDVIKVGFKRVKEIIDLMGK